MMWKPAKTTILFAFFLSFFIETIQYIFSLGIAESDDVIANTVGVGIGVISFLVSEQLKKRNNNPS